jgi:hypothetical protein
MEDTAVRALMYLRDTGEEPPGEVGEGRKLVMFVGLMSVPEDAELPNEAQVALAGDVLPELEGAINLVMLTKHAINHGRKYMGFDLGALLTMPIWRTR